MSTLKVNNVTDLGDDAIVTDGALVGAGKILQVVSTAFSGTFSVALAQGVFDDVTGLSVTITPTSSSSKIMIFAVLSGGNNLASSQARISFRLLRGSTPVGIGDTDSSHGRITATNNTSTSNSGFQMVSVSANFLDTPETTSPVTYKVQVGNVINSSATNTFFINRSAGVFDSIDNPRSISTITVMEVAG